jgi:hypothetical protein
MCRASINATDMPRKQLRASRCGRCNRAGAPRACRAILLSLMETIGVRELETAVSKALEATPFVDIHTHLFAPGFGKIGLWGIDELLTYHYLEAELFRSASIHPNRYWGLSKTQRADLVWDTLFVRNARFRKPRVVSSRSCRHWASMRTHALLDRCASSFRT